MDSSDVVKGTAAEASAYNALRADVVALYATVATIEAAASFHADYVQFEDEVRFEGDVNFKAYKVGDDTRYQFDTGAMFEWDDDMDRINAKVGGTVTAYCDSSGWTNV